MATVGFWRWMSYVGTYSFVFESPSLWCLILDAWAYTLLSLWSLYGILPLGGTVKIVPVPKASLEGDTSTGSN